MYKYSGVLLLDCWEQRESFETGLSSQEAETVIRTVVVIKWYNINSEGEYYNGGSDVGASESEPPGVPVRVL